MKNDLTKAAEALAQLDKESARAYTVAGRVTSLEQIFDYFAQGWETVTLPAEFNAIGWQDWQGTKGLSQGQIVQFINRNYRIDPTDTSNVLVRSLGETFQYNSTTFKFRRFMFENEVSDILQGNATLWASDSYEMADGQLARTVFKKGVVVGTSGSLYETTAVADEDDLAALKTSGVLIPAFLRYSSTKASAAPFAISYDINDLIEKLNPNFFPSDVTTNTQRQEYLYSVGASISLKAEIVTPNFQAQHKPAQAGESYFSASKIYISVKEGSHSLNVGAYAIEDPNGTDTKVWQLTYNFREQLTSGGDFYPIAYQSKTTFQPYDGTSSSNSAPFTDSYLRDLRFEINWPKPIENVFATRARMDEAEAELARQDERITNLGG